MGVRLRLPGPLSEVAEALEQAGIGPGDGADGLVFAAAPEPPPDYPALEAELLECFRLSKEAAAKGGPIVYVVAQADLLGQRGALGAMRAGALLSGLRSLALEGARAGLRANAVATGDEADPHRVARWIGHLLSESGVAGELVRVDAAHLGKLVP
jgi:hypothetical protein